MMYHHHKKRHTILGWIALLVFTAILLVSVWYIVKDIIALKREGYIHNARHRLYRSSPQQIRSWMTFNYINKLFSLPPAYLKTELSITAQNYPNISISSLASQQKQNPATEVAKVQKAVRAYLNTNPTK